MPPVFAANFINLYLYLPVTCIFKTTLLNFYKKTVVFDLKGVICCIKDLISWIGLWAKPLYDVGLRERWESSGEESLPRLEKKP